MGKSSALDHNPRTPARGRKIRIADLIHRVFRTLGRGASTPVSVPPERARDAPGEQLDAARYPTLPAPCPTALYGGRSPPLTPNIRSPARSANTDRQHGLESRRLTPPDA